VGWTTDEDELNYDYWWSNNDSDGQRMAKALGLKSPQPIMCSTRDSGDCLYMFKSGSKYYLWNLMSGDIFEIVMPVGVVDIVTKIAKLGVKALKTVEVEPVSTSN
jgi:hypothetical protein